MQILADLNDINGWLPDDKLIADDVDTAEFQVEARRIIKGQLSGVFTPAILFSWATPATTPDVIRGIAGRLIAAYYYRKRYSEDDPDIPAYAQRLYDEAIMMLTEIRMGTLIVLGPDDVPIADSGLSMSTLDFWPNDSTEGPYFTMDQEFA